MLRRTRCSKRVCLLAYASRLFSALALVVTNSTDLARLDDPHLGSLDCSAQGELADLHNQNGTRPIGKPGITSHGECLLPKTMDWHNAGPKFLLEEIRKAEPFSFVRYGDGEWKCIQGGDFKNCDDLPAHSDMCKELGDFTKDPASRKGITMLFDHHHICGFVKRINEYPPLGTWYKTFGFADALRYSQKGRMLSDIMAAVRARGPVVVVGPKYLGRLRAAFGHVGMVQVPNPKVCHDDGDAWTAREEIQRGILQESDRHPSSSVQFLAAGGMAMKVIIMRLAPTRSKDNFFDIGSTFDGFAGHGTRNYNGFYLKHELAGGPLESWFNEADEEGVGC